MAPKKDYYRIVHQDGVATYFHAIDSELIPLANFEIALQWYRERALTVRSELDVLEILRNPDIEKKYRRFLEEENEIISANSEVKREQPFLRPRCGRYPG